MPLKQPPRSNEVQDFGIGAPPAPPVKAPVFHLKPTSQQRIEASVKAAARRAAVETAKRNDAIFAARQDIATKNAIQQRVSAKAGLTTRASPFTGAEQGKGPGAKPGTKVESGDLTAQAKLAKARTQLLTHGGLQGPAQRLDEILAALDVAGSRNPRLSDTHVLPTALTTPSLHMNRPQPGYDIGAPAGLSPNNRPVPRGYQPNNPQIAPQDSGYSPSDIASLGLGTALSVASSVPRALLTPMRLGQTRTAAEDVTPTTLPKASADASARLNSYFGDTTAGVAEAIRGHHIALPRIDVTNMLTPEAKAAAKGQKVYLNDLTDTQRFGGFALGAQARKYFVHLAGTNGYNVKDAPTWNDAELAARALGPKNEPSITGFLRNLAADVAQQGALASAVPMFGNAIIQSIAQKSPAPALQLGGQYAQGIQKLLPFIGDRPWGENIYERPFSSYYAVAPGAKFISGRVGQAMRLSPTREATLPTQARAVEQGLLPAGAERVTLPASQHPLARLGQSAHDRVMAMGVHPDERAAMERASAVVRNPAAEISHAVKQVPQRVGSKLEQRVIRQRVDALHMKARLTAGHEPALALTQLFKSFRQLPMMRTLLQSWKENGGKEAEFEALIKHHGAASSADQLAESYNAHAQLSLQRAAELEIDAELAPSPAVAERYRAGAKELVADAKRQQEQAKYSQQSGIDIHAPAKGAQDVVDAMRVASRQSAAILKSQGLIDEKGQLYGDWQHRIDTIEHTEGPGTRLGGDSGTPGYQIAHAIIKEGGLREAHDVARAAYHGTTTHDVNEVPASMDVRSPLAEHHAGRSRFARSILQVVQRKQVARNERNTALAGRDLTQEAAASGLNPRGVQRAVQEAANQLDSKQSITQTAGHSRVARLAEDVRGLTTEEKNAHNARSNERINRLQADLHVAQVKKAPRVKIEELQREIAAEKQHLDEGFSPSADLLGQMRQHEKADMHRYAFEVSPAEINAIAGRVRNAQGGLEKTPEQMALLRSAIQQELDRSPALNHMALLAKSMEEDAAAQFKAHTGKSVELAHAMDRTSSAYLRALRSLRDQQVPLGHDPFHLHLHRPDTEYGLQPTTITTGVQWAEGNYTRDMHFLVARDLAGLQRKAVEGALFKALGNEDMIIHDPPPGSVIPPGWVEAPKDLITNLQKVNKDPGAVRELLQQWRDLGTGSHAGGRLQEDHVLVSRHMKDWMQQELERGNHEIGKLLAATNAYRRWMLFSLPRTYVNNTLGNPILAMVMGSRLRDLTEAIHVLRNHPDRIPHTLRRRGPISNVMEKANAKMVGWQAFWRNANAFSEDLGNVMVYLKHARGGFRNEANLAWFKHISKSNEMWVDYLKKAAKGEGDAAVAPSIKSAEAFGDMYRLSQHDKGLATAFLFHRWVGHMIHLTYWTLPTKYPGRGLFIQQTAILANQYRKEHGEFPSWAIAYVPLWHEMQQAGGLPQDVVWSLGTGGANPFATPGQSVDFGTVDQPKFPAQSLVANNLTPLLRVPIEAVYGHRLDTLQPFQDYHGNDITAGMNWRVLANGVIANLPIVNTVFPRAGLSDDTIQIPLHIPGTPIDNRLHPRFSTGAMYDPTMRSPQALGHGELYDWLLRVAGASGFPIRPVDAAGNRTTTSAGRTLDWQAQQASKRAAKAGAADFQSQIELFQRDPAAWRKKYGPGAKK